MNGTRSEIRLSSLAYVGWAFGNAYEAAAERLGRRPSCSIRPGVPGDHVIVLTDEPDVLAEIVAAAEADKVAIDRERKRQARTARIQRKVFTEMAQADTEVGRAIRAALDA